MDQLNTNKDGRFFNGTFELLSYEVVLGKEPILIVHCKFQNSEEERSYYYPFERLESEESFEDKIMYTMAWGFKFEE